MRRTTFRSRPVLVLALAMFFFLPMLLAPARAARPIWSLEETTRYYSDATYTTLVGKCVENGCTGQVSCWGVETDFIRQSNRVISC
jgi:hypothetical protein